MYDDSNSDTHGPLKRGRMPDSSSDSEDSDRGLSARYVGVSFQAGGVQSNADDSNQSSDQNSDEDEDDERPRFSMASVNSMMSHGSGFVSSNNSTQAPSDVHVKNYGIGAKLLGKMGYVPGQGLGTEGKGIVEPIEQKFRPSLLGLGALDEKTKQAKAAERRAKKVKPSSSNSDSDDYQPKYNANRKPKNLYKTIQELESEGLHIPTGFKHIIDMTAGEDGTIIENLSDIRLDDANQTVENDKLALYNTARQQLHTFSTQWEQLESRLVSNSAEIALLENEMEKKTRKLTRLEALYGILQNIESANKSRDFNTVSHELDVLQSEYMEDISEGPLQTLHIAASALKMYFEHELSDWSPLDNPTKFKAELVRWAPMLRLNIQEKSEIVQGDFADLMYTIWLPKAQSALTNDWDPLAPSAAILFLEEWEIYLPASIKALVVDQILMPKLQRALADWKPSQTTTLPDISVWLLPWIQYLDVKRWESIIDNVSSKISSILKSWSPNKTDWMLNGIKKWREILGSHTLNKHIHHSLVRRLEEYLHRHFVVDPSNQKIEPLKDVLAWTEELGPTLIGRILEAEFFPKLQNVLYEWLRKASDADLADVATWYETWAEWFPSKVADVPAVKAGFEQCLDLINRALDSDRKNFKKPEYKAALHMFSDGATKTTGLETTKMPDSEPVATAADSVSFKDIVEDYCSDHDLFFVSLRKPHPTLGHALFKISDNPGGHGGVTCYIKDNVLWATSKKDRKTYRPISLDELEDCI